MLALPLADRAAGTGARSSSSAACPRPPAWSSSRRSRCRRWSPTPWSCRSCCAGVARWSDANDLGGLILGIRRVTIVLVLLLGFVYFRVAGDALALVSDRSDLVRRSGAVRPGDPRWPVLEGRDEARRHRGARRRLRGLGLHAAAAVPGPRPAGCRPSFAGRGPLRARHPGPVRAVRARRSRHRQPLDAVEHAGQHRPVRRAVAGRAGPTPPSTSRRRCSSTCSRRPGEGADARFWRGTATVGELQGLLGRFLGPRGRPRGSGGLRGAHRRRHLAGRRRATPNLVHHVETLLGRCGRVGVRAVHGRVGRGRGAARRPRGDGDPRRDVAGAGLQPRAGAQVGASWRPRRHELREANERLQELDRLKDDFVSTVTHELRTPLTSIRAFSEILVDNPDLDAASSASATCGSSSRRPSG